MMEEVHVARTPNMHEGYYQLNWRVEVAKSQITRGNLLLLNFDALLKFVVQQELQVALNFSTRNCYHAKSDKTHSRSSHTCCSYRNESTQ